MKVRLLKDVDTTGGPMASGTVIEHADAGILVLLNIAERVEDLPAIDPQPVVETFTAGQAQ